MKKISLMTKDEILEEIKKYNQTLYDMMIGIEKQIPPEMFIHSLRIRLMTVRKCNGTFRFDEV
jgi:hypothetical protein